MYVVENWKTWPTRKWYTAVVNYSTHERTVIAIVIGGLESRGSTKAHDSGTKKNLPVGTIPGLTNVKRGPYSPNLSNPDYRSALCGASPSSEPTSFVWPPYVWTVNGTDQLTPP